MARAHRNASEKRPRVTAFVSAHRGAALVGQVTAHLEKQGVSVHLLDDESPDEAAPLAESDADWLIHHDVHEFLESPWLGIDLRAAIAIVDGLGYNAVDFEVFHFVATRELGSGQDVMETFEHYEPTVLPDHGQAQCWKRLEAAGPIPSRTHAKGFPARNVFPLPFLSRRYPAPGDAAETVRSAEHLLKFDPHKARIHLSLRNREVDQVDEKWQSELKRREEETAGERQQWQARLSTLEREAALLQRDKDALSRASGELEQRLGSVQLELAAASQRVPELEQQNRALEHELAEVRAGLQRVAALEEQNRFLQSSLDDALVALERVPQLRRENQSLLAQLDEALFALQQLTGLEAENRALASELRAASLRLGPLEQENRALRVQLDAARLVGQRVPELEQERRAVQSELEEARRALGRVPELEKQLREVFMSHSWRVTYPLRRGVSLLAAKLTRNR